MPDVDKELERDFLPMTVIMDSVRDAAAFGTLMRTAVAVGCQQVIAVKGEKGNHSYRSRSGLKLEFSDREKFSRF